MVCADVVTISVNRASRLGAEALNFAEMAESNRNHSFGARSVSLNKSLLGFSPFQNLFHKPIRLAFKKSPVASTKYPYEENPLQSNHHSHE